MSVWKKTPLVGLLPLLLLAACGGEELPASTTAGLSQPSAAVCPAMGQVLSGTVDEVQHVSRYTYLRLQLADGAAWAAVLRSDVEPGDRVRVVHAMPVRDFRSPTTGKLFPTLHLGYLASARAAPTGRCPALRGEAGEKVAI